MLRVVLMELLSGADSSEPGMVPELNAVLEHMIIIWCRILCYKRKSSSRQFRIYPVSYLSAPLIVIVCSFRSPDLTAAFVEGEVAGQKGK